MHAYDQTDNLALQVSLELVLSVSPSTDRTHMAKTAMHTPWSPGIIWLWLLDLGCIRAHLLASIIGYSSNSYFPSLFTKSRCHQTYNKCSNGNKKDNYNTIPQITWVGSTRTECNLGVTRKKMADINDDGKAFNQARNDT